MALVKFIETTSDKLDSLPIVEGRFTFTKDGKFYLDAGNASGIIERFLLNGDKILSDTTANWNAQSSLIAELNCIYVYTDHATAEDGTAVPGMKIGDGKAYLIDMPFTDTLLTEHIANTDIHITAEERDAWNNKVTCYVDASDDDASLIFTTENT